jgi:hypothetical protein
VLLGGSGERGAIRARRVPRRFSESRQRGETHSPSVLYPNLVDRKYVLMQDVRLMNQDAKHQGIILHFRQKRAFLFPNPESRIPNPQSQRL